MGVCAFGGLNISYKSISLSPAEGGIVEPGPDCDKPAVLIGISDAALSQLGRVQQALQFLP